MKRITIFAIFIWILASFSSTTSAEEKFVPDLKIWISTEKDGPNNSDYIFLKVRLFDETHKLIAELPKLIGPLQISTVNKQLFSFESNSIIGTKSALVFELDGKLAFSFEHLGYLRNFGITEDQRLYWLHYNIVKDNEPLNIVVIINSEGKVVFRDRFRKSRHIQFNYKEYNYRMDIPKAEWPG